MSPLVITIAGPLTHASQIARVLEIMAAGYRQAADAPGTPPDAYLQLTRDAEAFERAVATIRLGLAP